MAGDNIGLLSVEDFERKGIVIDPRWTSLEALLVVSLVASQKLEEGKIYAAKGSMKKRLGQCKVDSCGRASDQNKVRGVGDDDCGRGSCSSASPKVVSRLEKLKREKITKKSISEESVVAVGPPAQGKLLGEAMKRTRRCRADEEWLGENIKPRCQRKLKNNNKQTVLNLDMPQKLKQVIKGLRGTKIELVIQKVLYATDVSNNHNRLSIPVNQIKKEFLTQSEKDMLDADGGKMEVLLIEPSLDICKIVLKKWVMPKSDKKGKISCSYVLIKGWKNVKDRNELEERDEIQLWSFRVNSEPERLCLALVLLPRGGGEVGDDITDGSQVN